ncbi:FtsB family cell division protein [Moraxella lacunata]|uniref:Cell division protein FtsB n=1 Tax=Moraxella lacunata TaxID=477 RepID=A0A1V4GQZ2_MORLA|nr:septum formation initiator family protein [Moraxella lacunata]OPH35037.1 hypothetical protein B5J94_10235 [Moraxella lacunata]
MTTQKTDDTLSSEHQTRTQKVGVSFSPTFLGYLLLIIFGAVVLVGLQHQYWYGEFGYHTLSELNDELAKQQKINAAQQAVNDTLRADVRDLKSGLGAIEEHARLDLGLIKSGETFVELSVAPMVSDREVPYGVDGASATEPVDGLIDDDIGENAFTGVSGDTGE